MNWKILKRKISCFNYLFLTENNTVPYPDNKKILHTAQITTKQQLNNIGVIFDLIILNLKEIKNSGKFLKGPS